MKRLVGAAMTGLGLALLPLIALAAEPHGAEGVVVDGRALPPPVDFGSVLLVTVFAVAALFIVAALGYLYRRERHLDWPFQAAAVPHDEHAAH